MKGREGKRDLLQKSKAMQGEARGTIIIVHLVESTQGGITIRFRSNTQVAGESKSGYKWYIHRRPLHNIVLFLAIMIRFKSSQAISKNAKYIRSHAYISVLHNLHILSPFRLYTPHKFITHHSSLLANADPRFHHFLSPSIFDIRTVQPA